MTIKEIARLAGVSISTVSKIVNSKDASINPETRARVLKIVKEYNYSPYSRAITGSDAKTFILGVLLNSTANSSQFLNGAVTAAQKNGYGLLVYDSMGSPETELKNITAVCKNRVDGVIWEPLDIKNDSHESYLRKRGMEFCRFNDSSGFDSYFIDFTEIGYEATALLLSYGHTKVGCLIKSGSRRSEMVLEGFKKCLLEHGIPYHETMALPSESEEWHNQIYGKALTGIISTHYAAARRLTENLTQKRLQIPNDLSLISLQDESGVNMQTAKISSILIPYCEFGSFVCERLIEKCEKKKCQTPKFRTAYPITSEHSLDVPYFSRSKHITVVGSINIDVTFIVDELPQPGNVTSTSTSFRIPGGKGANQAVGAAKLGYDVSLIGKVGNDYDATLVYDSMTRNHVDTQGILHDPHTDTGKAFIHVQSNGESMITILRGANERLYPEDVLSLKELFKNTSYCLLQTEIPEETVEAAARLAHENGAKNILKPAATNHLTPALMKLIDIFVPNKAEAERLCPEAPTIEDNAEAFLRRGVKSVIITLGDSGCYINDPAFTGYLPAIHFTTIDTTGAADAFIAALAVYLTDGYPMERAAGIAAYAAGFSVARQGVIPALIDRNSLEAYIMKVNPGILRF